MTLPLPNVVMRDDTEHGTKYCTLLDALAYGAARAHAERDACIAICDLEASKSLEMSDLEAYYGTSAYAISNAIKARGTT